MKAVRTLFTDHPASVNESYLEHMAMSASFGRALLAAAFCAFIHALFPFLFEKTASGIINRLYSRMVSHRVVKAPKASPKSANETPAMGTYYI
ncbi:DUF6356 family protein [Sneathiella limimaris]|uniref:DUF6356 family protein n=1 Tax=Sneathiella limimaris TaxID=1964213 RepID=UPI0019D128F5|nr:DUF6356 family protein [Sneathiella limimaris]